MPDEDGVLLLFKCKLQSETKVLRQWGVCFLQGELFDQRCCCSRRNSLAWGCVAWSSWNTFSLQRVQILMWPRTVLAKEGLAAGASHQGGFEVAMGDAEVCPVSWLNAELTDLTAAWSSRTRASHCSLLPRSQRLLLLLAVCGAWRRSWDSWLSAGFGAELSGFGILAFCSSSIFVDHAWSMLLSGAVYGGFSLWALLVTDSSNYLHFFSK